MLDTACVKCLPCVSHGFLHSDDSDGPSVAQRHIEAFASIVSTSLVKSHAGKRRDHLESPKSAVKRCALACVENERSNSAPRPRRMHEERPDFRGLACRVEKNLVVPVPLISAEQRLPAAPTSAADQVRAPRSLDRYLRCEIRAIVDQRCVDAVHVGDGRIDLGS